MPGRTVLLEGEQLELSSWSGSSNLESRNCRFGSTLVVAAGFFDSVFAKSDVIGGLGSFIS